MHINTRVATTSAFKKLLLPSYNFIYIPTNFVQKQILVEVHENQVAAGYHGYC